MTTPDSNVWFYTLSTISQTCAAILALGGTFVIFKLDKLQTALSNYRGRVVAIIQMWRGESKKPDAFFDETDRDIRDQYLDIVNDNQNQLDKLFNEHIDGIYESFEGRPIGLGVGGPQQDKINQVRAERERWCNRMVDLYSKNIELKVYIFRHFRRALAVLTISIILSVSLLKMGFESAAISEILFSITTGFSIISITYTSYAVWKISVKNPIT